MINIFKRKTRDVKNNKNLVLIYTVFLHAIKIEENYINKKKSIIPKALSDFQIKRKVIPKPFLIKQK